jgi:hypothetical protein
VGFPASSNLSSVMVCVLGIDSNRSKFGYENLRTDLSSGNACCYSYDQNLLSYRLLHKDVKIKSYKIMLYIVSCGRGTWPLTLRGHAVA